MIDVWGLGLGEEAQLRLDLEEEVRLSAADFLILRRIVPAALVASYDDRTPPSNDTGCARIVIPLRATPTRA
jgi:hypothetical protein